MTNGHGNFFYPLDVKCPRTNKFIGVVTVVRRPSLVFHSLGGLPAQRFEQDNRTSLQVSKHSGSTYQGEGEGGGGGGGEGEGEGEERGRGRGRRKEEGGEEEGEGEGEGRGRGGGGGRGGGQGRDKMLQSGVSK